MLGRPPWLRILFGFALLLGVTFVWGARPSGAEQSATFSATGVCVNGTPEAAFSVTGVPSHTSLQFTYQHVDLAYPAGTDSVQFQTSGGMTNVLWNISALGGLTGPVNVAVIAPSLVNSQNPYGELTATNLSTQNLIQFSYYSLRLPACVAGPTEPVVASVSTPDGKGYWQVTPDGQVHGFGDAAWAGDMAGTPVPLNRPIVGIASTPDGNGYWLVASDGGVFACGDATFYGSMGAKPLNEPVVGIAPTPDGGGYWLVASDGGVFAFGDAKFQGSTGAIHLNQPVVGMTLDKSTGGYWLVASDGGVFAFGAPFFGSAGNIKLNRPVVAMDSETGVGYRIVASDGGVFTYGQSPFFGSLGSTSLAFPVIGILGSTGDQGYTMVASDGGVFPFGNAVSYGTVSGAVPLP